MVRSMLSLMSGLGNGYNQGKQQEFENERKTKLDQIALDRAARDTTEFDQSQADRSELRNAAAPVRAAPDMAPTPDGSPVQRMLPDPSSDNRDAGEAGTAPALPAQRVGMQGMLSPQQAGAMVAQSNSPEAVRARQLAVLQRQSPEKAAILAAHDLSLKNTQMDMANKEFDAAINTAATKGWDSLGEFMNNSTVSPSRGKWLPSADGKTMQAHKEGPNGELVPTPAIFENSPKGQIEAAQFFSKQIPIKEKLKHYVDEKTADRKGKVDEANINESNAKADYYRGLNPTKLDVAAMKGSGSKADHFDEKEWDAANKIEPSFVSFNDDAGGKPVESPELRLVYRSELNTARAAGNHSPQEAAEAARTTTLKLKNAATDMVAADRKKAKDSGIFDRYTSTMTEAEAVRVVLAKYEASQKLLRQSAPGATPDPLNVRKPDRYGLRDAPGGTTTTTRAPTSMEIVMQDMKKNGITSATATLDGNPKVQIGTPTQTVAANPASSEGVPATADSATSAAGRMQGVAAAQNLELAGQRLDDARVATAKANSALQRFGSRQRLADQKGFRAASTAAQAARQRQNEAEAAYAAIAAQGPTSKQPAFRYASP